MSFPRRREPSLSENSWIPVVTGMTEKIIIILIKTMPKQQKTKEVKKVEKTTTVAVSKSAHPSTERTLVVIKPDGIQRSLIGEIIGRYEKLGLKLSAIKMLVPKAEFVEQHYTLDPNWRRVTG